MILIIFVQIIMCCWAHRDSTLVRLFLLLLSLVARVWIEAQQYNRPYSARNDFDHFVP